MEHFPLVHICKLYSIYVSFIAKCEWGSWNVGQCSTTCGEGLRIDTRNKTVIENEGEFCVGKSTKPETCNIRECPGNTPSSTL